MELKYFNLKAEVGSEEYEDLAYFYREWDLDPLTIKEVGYVDHEHYGKLIFYKNDSDEYCTVVERDSICTKNIEELKAFLKENM